MENELTPSTTPVEPQSQPPVSPPEPPQIQPLPPQPQPQSQPLTPLPQTPPIQSMSQAPIVSGPQVAPASPEQSQSAPKSKRNLLFPSIIGAVSIIIVVVIVVLFILNKGTYSVSIKNVRDYCNNYGLEIVVDTKEDSVKAEYIECVFSSLYDTSKPGTITYTTLDEGSLEDHDEFKRTLDYLKQSAIVTEKNDNYTKYYLNGNSLGYAGYIIVEKNAYIAITGDEPIIRAALIEMGYPDKNWATTEGSQNNSSTKSNSSQQSTNESQIAQRDTARRNDIARVDTSLVQYQTNNQGTNGGSNLPEDSDTWIGTKEISKCQSSACMFVRDYMNTRTGSGTVENSFIDPDGTYYSLNIGSGPFSYSDTEMDHTIYIRTSAKCDGEKAVESTKRHFVIIYRLEGAGTYCIDDQ